MPYVYSEGGNIWVSLIVFQPRTVARGRRGADDTICVPRLAGPQSLGDETIQRRDAERVDRWEARGAHTVVLFCGVGIPVVGGLAFLRFCADLNNNHEKTMKATSSMLEL